MSRSIMQFTPAHRLVPELEKLDGVLDGEVLDGARKHVIRRYKTNEIVDKSKENPSFPQEFIADLQKEWKHWYDSIIPKRKDTAYNSRVGKAEELTYNATGFEKRGLLDTGNFMSASIYGTAAGYGGAQLLKILIGDMNMSDAESAQLIDYVGVSTGTLVGICVGALVSLESRELRKKAMNDAKYLSGVLEKLYSK